MSLNKNIVWIATVVLCLSFMINVSLPTEAEETATLTVTYSGCWSGAYGSEGSTTSIDGCGTKSYTAEGVVFSITAQKDHDSTNELCVSISASETVSECTSAAYGVAAVGLGADGSDWVMMIQVCCGAIVLIVILFFWWRNNQKKKQIAAAVSQGISHAIASQPQAPPPPAAPAAPAEEDKIAKIKEAKELLDSGAITEEEYSEMKGKYL